MSTRLILISATLVLATLLSGCGPTTEGLKARSEAQGRMNLIGAQVHFDQAKQLFNSGQFEKARREITHAIARYPDSPPYYLLKGRIHLEIHELEAAVDAFKTALAKDPKFAEAHYFTGIVYQRWSDDQRAYEHYFQAFELEPAKAQYLLAAAETLVSLGEFSAALAIIESKMSYFEHNSALRQLQGQIAMLQGQPALAAALFTQARMLNPDDDMLMEELMWAQYSASMYGQCLDTIKSLQSRLREKRSDLLHLEARCLSMIGRDNDARERYMELTRMRPADPVAWSELGILAWDLGDYRRVAMCSAQLIALAPERHEGYLLKGVNERQRGNLEQAIELFAQSCERGSDALLPRLLLGQSLEQAGRPDQAMAAYQSALAIEPDSAEAAQCLRRLTDGRRITSAPTQ